MGLLTLEQWECCTLLLDLSALSLLFQISEPGDEGRWSSGMAKVVTLGQKLQLQDLVAGDK